MLLLVIEDVAIQRMLLASVFAETTANQIVLAKSLAEADTLLDDVSFIVLDLTLDDADPAQSIEWAGNTGLPTIVYSATWTEDVIQLAAEKVNIVSFLTKGSPADSILASIHFALAKENLLCHSRTHRIEACKELAERMRARLQNLPEGTLCEC